MKKIFAFLCLLVLISTTPPTIAIEVPAGTNIPLNILQNQTSKTVVAGSTIEARITENIKINNVLVFKQGDRALLNILTAKKAKFVGVPGEMLIAGGTVYDTNGKGHRFDYTQQIIGEEKTWPKVCLGCGLLIILAPIALFGFVKGGQAELSSTYTIDARLTSGFIF